MENEITNIVELHDGSINYHGEIVIKVKRGKRVIETLKYNNQGTLKLFKFLALCAAGMYDTADNQKPKYIRIFKGGAAGETIPSTAAEIIQLMTPESCRTTTAIMYNTTPEIIEDAGNTKASAKLKFFIPSSQLTDWENLNLLGLYSAAERGTSANGNVAAFFTVKNTSDTTKWGSLIANDPGSSDYNLEILWTLTFKN